MYTTTRINLTLPINFLDVVDEAASSQGLNRSASIRIALMEKLKLSSMLDLEFAQETTNSVKTKEELAVERFLKDVDSGKFIPDIHGKTEGVIPRILVE